MVRRALHVVCGGYVRPPHFAEGWSPDEASERIVAGQQRIFGHVCELCVWGDYYGCTTWKYQQFAPEAHGMRSHMMFPTSYPSVHASRPVIK